MMSSTRPTQTVMLRSFVKSFIKGLSVAFLLAICGCKGNQTNLPRLEFSHDSCDVGKVKKSSPVKDFDIEFKNTGGQTLNVYNVKPTCSCTEVSAVDSFVEPGAKGHIRGTFDMSDYPAGHIIKHVVVFSNGTDKPMNYFIVGDITYE